MDKVVYTMERSAIKRNKVLIPATKQTLCYVKEARHWGHILNNSISVKCPKGANPQRQIRVCQGLGGQKNGEELLTGTQFLSNVVNMVLTFVQL